MELSGGENRDFQLTLTHGEKNTKVAGSFAKKPRIAIMMRYYGLNLREVMKLLLLPYMNGILWICLIMERS